jgi:hypothetical protein
MKSRQTLKTNLRQTRDLLLPRLLSGQTEPSLTEKISNSSR